MRRTTMERRAVTTVVALVVALLVPASAASASCVLDQRPLQAKVDEAEIVFVGTVTGLQNGERTAQFAVEEVWKGRVPRTVAVHGGPEEPNMATSNDRTWVAGARYLVFPLAEGARLTDNFCTPTVEWSPDLAEARPEDAVAPDYTAEPSEPGGDAATDTGPESGQPHELAEGTGSSRLLPIGLGVAALGLAVALVVRRRRSPGSPA